MNKKLIAAIGFMLAFCAGIYFYAEWLKQKFDASLPEPPAPTEVQAAETETEAGHWHGDEWHAEPHTAEDAIANPQAPTQDEVNLIPLDFTETATSTTYSLPAGLSREQEAKILEAETKWRQEVWEPARVEWLELAKQKTKIFPLTDEDFLTKVENMSDEERAELIAKFKANDEQTMAAYERLLDIERNMPNFVAEVLGGE